MMECILHNMLIKRKQLRLPNTRLIFLWQRSHGNYIFYYQTSSLYLLFVARSHSLWLEMIYNKQINNLLLCVIELWFNSGLQLKMMKRIISK